MRQRRPIPLAVVLTSFDPGGTEHQMTELICRLDPHSFSVHVASLSGRGTLRQRVASLWPVADFPLASLRSPGTARQMWRLAAWLRARGIQALIACDFYANVFALPAAALARVPVRIGARRDVSVPERTPAQQLLQRLAYRLAHRVAANSSAAVECLRAEGVADWRIACIPNGIDCSRFAAHEPRRRLRVITTVAHLRPGKGHEVLLRAAARVLHLVPDARFQIVGDGARRRELEREASALRISAQVAFLGHMDDVPAVLRQSDLFAFPSFMEASPNALIEAMAAGVPVVATRTGGIPEVVEHERTGLLVPPGDDRALAAALLRLIERPRLASALGAAARQTIQARFSFDRMVHAFEELIVNELSARGAPEGLTWAASSGN